MQKRKVRLWGLFAILIVWIGVQEFIVATLLDWARQLR